MAPDSITLHPDFIDFCKSHKETVNLPDTLINTKPEVSVRVNTLKGALIPQNAERVPWCDDGFYLDTRAQFTFDPALHQGLYYVQDASSMIMARVVHELSRDIEAPLFLDACAAPGGKTTAAINALPANAAVVANEYDARRADALAENLERWGHSAMMVRRGDTSVFATMSPTFDIIAADVPCSGEGMMRKEPAAVLQWSRQLIDSCAALQREIVTNLWTALRPGGVLVYSTCTFNCRENEDNLRYIVETLGGVSLDLELDRFNGVTKALVEDFPYHCYHFIPGCVRGEGLFIAAIRKPGNMAGGASGRRSARARKSPYQPVDKKTSAALSSWMVGDYSFYTTPAGNIISLPLLWAERLTSLASELGGVMMLGIETATAKGKDLIPAHALALCRDINRNAFETCKVDWPTAISFLRREPLTLPGSTPRGHVLLTYSPGQQCGGDGACPEYPLGFVKNLGNRANNLLPQHRRIISRSVPENPVRVL